MTVLRRRAARGQIIVIFALAMALFLFGLICLVVDSAYLFTYSARAQAAAQVAAQAGANTIDSVTIYSSTGVIHIDHKQYQQACTRAARQFVGAGNGVSVNVLCGTDPPNTPPTDDPTKDTVAARVEVTVPLPVGLFGTRFTVRGYAEAAPVVGSTCPAPPNGPPPKTCPPPTPGVNGG